MKHLFGSPKIGPSLLSQNINRGVEKLITMVEYLVEYLVEFPYRVASDQRKTVI